MSDRSRAAALVGLIWAFAVLGTANAQPHDLSRCLTGPGEPPDCEETGGRGVIVFGCQNTFTNYYGNVAWFPLLCVGPISFEVEIAAPQDTRYPLYVEVVPLSSAVPCNSHLGRVIMVVRGTSNGDCGWESVENVDITDVVPLGSRYAIRLHFFGHPAGFSPAVSCIRLTAQPIISGVNAKTWGTVKSLYR